MEIGERLPVLVAHDEAGVVPQQTKAAGSGEDIGWKILKVRRYYNGMKRNLINSIKTAGSGVLRRYLNFVGGRGIVVHRDIIWKANLSWANG